MSVDGKREAEVLYSLIYLNIMRKTSKAERKTEGKIEQGYCTINGWGNTANRAFFVETGSVKEIWSCLLYQPKKAVPQKKNGSRIHKSVPRKVNSPLHSADVLSSRCKLAFSFPHWFQHFTCEK